MSNLIPVPRTTLSIVCLLLFLGIALEVPRPEASPSSVKTTSVEKLHGDPAMFVSPAPWPLSGEEFELNFVLTSGLQLIRPAELTQIGSVLEVRVELRNTGVGVPNPSPRHLWMQGSTRSTH